MKSIKLVALTICFSMSFCSLSAREEKVVENCRGKCFGHAHRSRDCNNKNIDCDEVHVISRVPAVIDRPGKWCVNEDLVYNGTGAAITITASNVTLNFHNHSLTLTNPSAVGVLALSIKELVVENDIIQSSLISTNPLSAAFHLLNCEKVTLNNIFTANTFFGIHAVNTRDLFVTHSRFRDHIGGGDTFDLLSGALRADTCNAVVVEQSTFNGAGRGFSEGNSSSQVLFRDGCTACRISNCEFENIENAVLGLSVDGLVIENCVTQTAERLDTSNLQIFFLPVIQLGNASPGMDIVASNVTIRNCLLNGSFDQNSTTPNFNFQAPINLGKSSIILIDKCEMGNFITMTVEDNQRALIEILSDPEVVRSNHIEIRDCTLRGALGQNTTNGFNCINADQIIIGGCFITNTFTGILVDNFSKSIVIRDNTIDRAQLLGVEIGVGIEDVIISNNYIMNTGNTALQIIDLTGGFIQNVTVEGNTIINSLNNGIITENSVNVVIRNNIIETVANSGIIVGPTDDSIEGPGTLKVTIENNTVIAANRNGISAQNVRENAVCNNTAIRGNSVSGSGDSGINLFKTQITLIQDNICTNNCLNSKPTDVDVGGIFITKSLSTELIGNSCLGNNLIGIGVIDSTITSIKGNSVSSSGTYGIVISGSQRTVLQDNTSNSNGIATTELIYAGILVNASQLTELTGNNCFENQGSGIRIGGGSQGTFLESNITVRNDSFGIKNDGNISEVTAFYNKSCKNLDANCSKIPLIQAPGSNTFIAGANLCCRDPNIDEAENAKAQNAKAKKAKAKKAKANSKINLQPIEAQNAEIESESRPEEL